MSRIGMGMASLIAALHASSYWLSIEDEYAEAIAPLTAMGKLDHAFFAERERASNHA